MHHRLGPNYQQLVSMDQIIATTQSGSILSPHTNDNRYIRYGDDEEVEDLGFTGYHRPRKNSKDTPIKLNSGDQIIDENLETTEQA